MTCRCILRRAIYWRISLILAGLTQANCITNLLSYEI
jgi:hypothetical protein